MIHLCQACQVPKIPGRLPRRLRQDDCLNPGIWYYPKQQSSSSLSIFLMEGELYLCIMNVT